jgi:hypothetical protein
MITPQSSVVVHVESQSQTQGLGVPLGEEDAVDIARPAIPEAASSGDEQERNARGE